MTKQANGNRAWGAVFILLPILCIFVSLALGAFRVPVIHVFQILWGHLTGSIPAEITSLEASIVWDVRLPRVLGAVAAGCGLSMAGGVFQALFGNPLADPYTLGVSNGAGFGAALAIVLSFSAMLIQVSALLFGLISVGLTFLLAGRKRRAPVTMILSGMLVSAFFASLVSLLKFTADPQEKLPQIVYWLMGSLAGLRYTRLLVIFPGFLAAGVVLFLYRWRINILSMGNREAKSLGLNVRRDRTVVILAATLLTALVVSISGIIGWVGIVIPHLARMIVGPDFRKLLPVSASLGTCYLLVIDDLCRTLSAQEIPIGVITGIIGIPIFLYFILREKVSWA